MSKWTIYDKKGNPLHESVTELNGDGRVVYQDTLEYSGKWMGERFLTVSIKSAYPIDFRIGDYITYRGERFTINYDPTVIKKSRRGTYGEGFTYDSIKFNSPSNELTQMRFHDWVLSDNKLHYTSLPSFSFYAKDVDDLVDRLQACSDRWCKDNGYPKEDYWLFFTLRNNTITGTADPRQTQTTYQRTLSRAKDVLECCGISETGTEGKEYLAAVKKEWEDRYGIGNDYADSRDDERYDRTISISSQSVWDGMSMIKKEFGLNFIVRGRNVYVGTAGVPTSHLFKYGKGNGLYEVDRTADQDQAVVTKLHAYGSSDNLPTRYYADLNTVAYGEITNISDNSKETNLFTRFELDFDYASRYFTEPLTKYGSDIYAVKIRIDDISVNARVQKASGNNHVEIYSECYAEATELDDNTDIDNFGKFQNAIAVGKRIIFTAGIKRDAWPVSRITASTKNLPDNMAVNFLMLPGFPNYSLADICRAEYDKTNDVTSYYITNPNTKVETLFHTESGNHVIRFSSDKYDPYIVSPNADELGIKDYDISCTEEDDDNGLEKVYPTIEKITEAAAGIGSAGKRLDEIYKADVVDDNGVFPKSTTSEEKIPGFHVWLPELGFDLRQAARDAGGSEIQISMKDGFCGGRTFSVTNVSQEKDGTWNLSCKRAPDDNLDLYFPYSYAKSVPDVDSSMTNAYQICKGDHYVLTGISVSDVNYVWAASVKLLRKAIHWLCKNDYTRYVYQPKIDEIYMAREAEEAKGQGKSSLHDSLMEGDILLFSDDDLGIDGKVYIDQLNIKENGNNGIPTYDVTLRNEVTVGSLQRLQNKVDSIATDVKSGNVGGGLTSPSQVASIIKAYGKEWFLSKLLDDTASGLITFVKGLVSKAKAVFQDDVEVDKNLDVNGNLSVGGDASANGSTGSNKITVGTYKAGVSGAVLQNTKDGSFFEVDRMLVRAKATFNSLEIAKIQYSSGQRIVGKGGVVLTKVEEIKDDDTNAKTTAYKCYFQCKVDGRYYHNPFIVNDQAIAQSWDDDANSGNHRYWRLVTEVGEDAATGVGYIVLSNASDKCEANSDAPRVDDEVCQLGYQGTDQPDRQSAIMESTIGDSAPCYTMFQNIKSFSLKDCDILTFGNKNGKGFIKIYGDAYIGDRGENTYIKYDSNSENKQLDIKAKITAIAGSDFTDSGMEKGEGNLIRNSGFTGDYSSAVIEDGATITSDTKIYSDPWGSWSLHTGCTINDDAVSASGKSCTLDSGTLTQTIAYPLLQGTYMLTLMHKNDEQLTITFGGATIIVNASANYKRENIKVNVTDTSATTFTITGSGTICELQLQAGNVSSAAWTPSHSDNNRYLGYYSALQYLLDAIANGSTQTLGGLILTQMLKVGNYTDGAMTQETGGMNGEYSNDNSPFLWGGGTLEQAIATIAMYAEDPNFSPTDEQLKQMAKFVVTHGGRAILTDMIMRGYIYALGGVFKGDIRVDGTLTGGTLKGTTVEGVKGTFKELSALDAKGVAKAGIHLSEEGWLAFDGDIYSQGENSEENRLYRYYSGDIFCRGSFGHRSRFVALVTGSTMQVFPKNDDGATAVTLNLESATTANGKTYYRVPLFVSPMTIPADFLDTSKDLSDVSGMPIDVVAFNVTAETYYLLTDLGCGKGVDVVNTNDKVNVYLGDNGGWNMLLGGASTRFFYLPPKFISNPPTTEGVGLFKLDDHGINW